MFGSSRRLRQMKVKGHGRRPQRLGGSTTDPQSLSRFYDDDDDFMPRKRSGLQVNRWTPSRSCCASFLVGDGFFFLIFKLRWSNQTWTKPKNKKASQFGSVGSKVSWLHRFIPRFDKDVTEGLFQTIKRRRDEVEFIWKFWYEIWIWLADSSVLQN